MNIISLGRYGDILNILPACYGLAQRGQKPTLIVSAQFADILDGVDYVNVRKYSGEPENLHHVIALCSQLPDLRVAQVNRNPDQRHLEDSYCKEAYRLAELHGLFKRYPLVFNKRDRDRERELLGRVFPKVYDIEPFIAVATNGVSSPFKNSKQLVDGLRSRFPEMRIVSLDGIKAEKPYDLLGVMDCCSCLVTVDTMHLHLANAAKCPTVCLLNDGWRGSAIPATCVGSMRYTRFQVDQLCDMVEVSLEKTNMVWGIIDLYGNERRHRVAKKSYSKFDHLLTTEGIARTAVDIGDTRSLPMLKDMLGRALTFARAGDVIVWTNDDVEILDLGPLVSHVGKFGAVTMRRDPAHMGRELMAFKWEWLADKFHDFPDGVVACPWFDLAIAAWVRKRFGIRSDFDNISRDFYPCEIPNDGIFIHPNDHESTWTEYMKYPASIHNERLWKEQIK